MTLLPPPVLPNAFLYDVAFIGILAVVLVLVAMLPLLRRLYFAAVLILIGIIEFFIIANPRYTIPLDVFILPFLTIINGLVIPIFYATRQLFGKKVVKLLLIFSGCVELALGAISLLYIDVVDYFDENVYVIFHVNTEFLLLGTMLATVGIYSLAVGTFLLITKPRDR